MSSRVVKRNRKFSGNSFSVYRYQIDLDGRRFERDIIERNHGVIIVPVRKNGNVLLLREHCAGSNSFILSLPGGSIECGEDVAAAAIRELREETGHDCHRLIKLHFAYSHPSTSTRRSHSFLAYDLFESPLKASGEILEVAETPLEDAIRNVAVDFESDVSTLGLLLLARERLHRIE